MSKPIIARSVFNNNSYYYFKGFTHFPNIMKSSQYIQYWSLFCNLKAMKYFYSIYMGMSLMTMMKWMSLVSDLHITWSSTMKQSHITCPVNRFVSKYLSSTDIGRLGQKQRIIYIYHIIWIGCANSHVISWIDEMSLCRLSKRPFGVICQYISD